MSGGSIGEHVDVGNSNAIGSLCCITWRHSIYIHTSFEVDRASRCHNRSWNMWERQSLKPYTLSRCWKTTGYLQINCKQCRFIYTCSSATLGYFSSKWDPNILTYILSVWMRLPPKFRSWLGLSILYLLEKNTLPKKWRLHWKTIGFGRVTH